MSQTQQSLAAAAAPAAPASTLVELDAETLRYVVGGKQEGPVGGWGDAISQGPVGGW